MRKNGFLILIATAMLMAACHPVEDPKEFTKGVTVTTADPILVINTNATLGAEVTAAVPDLLVGCAAAAVGIIIDDIDRGGAGECKHGA